MILHQNDALFSCPVQQESGGENNPNFAEYASFVKDKTQGVFRQQWFRSAKDSVLETKQTIIDENAFRYGGLTSKTYRQKIREQRLKGMTMASQQDVSENPEYVPLICYQL